MKRLLGTAIVALVGLTMAALSAGMECDDPPVVERSGQMSIKTTYVREKKLTIMSADIASGNIIAEPIVNL